MKSMMSFVKILVVVLVLVVVGVVVIKNWSFIFAKTVRGEIVNVERVTQPTAIIGSRATPEQIHSYSILIQSEDGKLYTASSEDRQWQVIKKGYRVVAKLYVYPPWDFEKGNTYFNARVMEVQKLSGDQPAEVAAPASDAPAAAESAAEQVK